MDISFFKRGIRLPRRPAYGQPKELPPPERVRLPLGGDEGPALAPTVRPGDRVRIGQVVADDGEGGVVHAPVSGEVTGVEDLLLAVGSKVPALVIESDGADEALETGIEDDGLSAGADALLERIRAAGVRRGASPLAAYLGEARAAGEVRALVVRFTDEDPYLGALEAVTAELEADAARLSTGVELARKVTGAKALVFVLEKRQAAPAVEKLAAELGARVLRRDGFDYPSLADALLAREALGSESTIDPSRVHTSGAVVLDVDNLLEAARAATRGEPVTEKVITAAGPRGAGALKVRVGAPIGEIADAVGGRADLRKLILGGPLLGRACHTLDYPFTREARGVTFQAEEETVQAADHPCLGCGLCAEVCPMRLVPGMLSRYCEYDQWSAAEGAHLFRCIECGCCAYVCPAGRSMVQLFVHGKKEARAREEVES
jgi:electron transport complex protein RnfC